MITVRSVKCGGAKVPPSEPSLFVCFVNTFFLNIFPLPMQSNCLSSIYYILINVIPVVYADPSDHNFFTMKTITIMAGGVLLFIILILCIVVCCCCCCCCCCCRRRKSSIDISTVGCIDTVVLVVNRSIHKRFMQLVSKNVLFVL